MISKEKAVALRQALGIQTVEEGDDYVTIGPLDDGLIEMMRPLSARMRIFLETYRQTRNFTETADLICVPVPVIKSWIRGGGQFAKCYDAIEEEVTQALEDVLAERAFNGFREELYAVDNDGNEVLKAVKVKQDPQYLKAVLAARDPAKYGRDGAEGSVTVQIIQVNEGKGAR